MMAYYTHNPAFVRSDLYIIGQLGLILDLAEYVAIICLKLCGSHSDSFHFCLPKTVNV